MWRSLLLLFVIGFLGCSQQQEREPSIETPTHTRFELLDQNHTGIAFSNTLQENDSINVILYDYLYNGGGVAAGDLNNDGYPDLYFTGNQVNDKVYLNNGDFSFSDVTEEWGVDQYPGWSSGAVMVDINGDGWLDVYVCRTGPHKNPVKRTNRLFINQEGKGFKEEAGNYGLDYTGHSTMAAFFDADRDGDLDCYLMTHPDQFRNRINLAEIQALIDAGLMESDRFFRNDNGRFIDASKEAGIQDFAFGLGLVIEDFNHDGWPDIYVSNDFDEGDALYINNQNGTFTNRVTEVLKHTANYGMGCDAADFNNDLFVDLVQVDMAFETHERAKRNMGAMDPQRFDLRVKLGWHYQYMENMLQLNNGDGTFSEIARSAGVHKTDWSWAALFADFDHDGFQDLLVTNGYKRDTKDNDLKQNINQRVAQGGVLDVDDVLSMIPATTLRNYMFKNRGDLTFERVNQEWGLHEKVNSNGAVYVDLDGDGDLDLVINNMDAAASIYRNNTVEQATTESNWAVFRLPATYATGARVVVVTENGSAMRYVQPTRGYLGSVTHDVHFGLGSAKQIDTLKIWWPAGGGLTLAGLEVNTVHDLVYANEAEPLRNITKPAFFADRTSETGIRFRHAENRFDDFEREVLLPHKMSEYGPGIQQADFNNDGIADLWVGGASGQSGAVYIGSANGTYNHIPQPAFESHAACEDVAAAAIDVNGDGLLDLYVVSGDASKGENNLALRDRLYINTGNGLFRDVTATLPDVRIAGGCVAVGDVDGDGRDDLFIGGRNIPGQYPFPPQSQLLLNTGVGLIDATAKWFGENFSPGMLTDALFHRFEDDQAPSLVIVGEWMAPTRYRNLGDRFDSGSPIASQQEGWWFSLAIADLDGDGFDDVICGNLGTNNKFQPSADKPLYVYANDFDGNGTIDIVLAKHDHSKLVPVRGLECSSTQMPYIAERFDRYADFASSRLDEIYAPELLETAYRPEARTFETTVFYGSEAGVFQPKALPTLAQIAPVRTLVVTDLNNDRRPDLIFAGNLFGAEVETTRYDAGNGCVLLNEGDREFRAMLAHESGLSLPFDSRKSVYVKHPAGRQQLITAVNNMLISVHETVK